MERAKRIVDNALSTNRNNPKNKTDITGFAKASLDILAYVFDNPDSTKTDYDKEWRLRVATMNEGAYTPEGSELGGELDKLEQRAMYPTIEDYIDPFIKTTPARCYSFLEEAFNLYGYGYVDSVEDGVRAVGDRVALSPLAEDRLKGWKTLPRYARKLLSPHALLVCLEDLKPLS